MKKYILIISFFTIYLLSATVDKNLFEGKNLDTYYDKLLTNLKESNNSTQNAIIQSEKELIYKIKKFQKLPPLKYQLNTVVDKKHLSEKYFLTLLYNFGKLKTLTDKIKKDMATNRLRLSFYRNKIENIIEDEKDKLLLYQLQYAFYKLNQNYLQKELNIYKEHLKNDLPMLYEVFNKISFQDRKKDIENTEHKISSLQNELSMLNIKLQTYQMQKSFLQKRLQKKQKKLKEKLDTLLEQRMKDEFAQTLYYIQIMNKDLFFTIIDKINEDMEQLPQKIKKNYIFQKRVIYDLAKKRFGTTTIAISNTKETLKDTVVYLFNLVNKPLFVYNEQPFSIISILKIVFVLFIGFLIGKIFQSKIKKFEQKRSLINRSSLKLIGNIGYYIIILITFLIALNTIGLNLSSISLIAGALSVGIGFGLQTVVSNLAAGIILMVERSIRIGDFIELSENLRGRVEDIKMRSTVITTNDNINVIVPNSTFIQNNVINWTLENDIKRIHIPFGVTYGTKVEDVTKAVLGELSNSHLPYFKHDRVKKPEIWMIEMGDSSVNYELIVWVYGEATKHPRATRSEFLKMIYSALYKHNIEIPFPQMDLHIKDIADGYGHL